MGTSVQILTVDDSATMRKVVEFALEPTNHTVLAACDGTEGLRLARTSHPELILLDHVLPDLSGPEFCRELLKGLSTKSIRVIVITGHDSSVREEYRECPNTVDFLSKPFPSVVLQNLVESTLSQPNPLLPSSSN
jgi:CheY-like chemotaxis protein